MLPFEPLIIETPFDQAYPIITEAFNSYRQMSETAREVYRNSLADTVLQLPSGLWWTLFQPDPPAGKVISHTQGAAEAKATIRRLTESWASEKPIDPIILEYHLESAARSACRRSAGLFAEWDSARLDGWLSVLETEFPDFNKRLLADAEQDEKTRRLALDTPYALPNKGVRWTARVPARFLQDGGRRQYEDEDELVFTDGTNYPKDGLQRLEEDYRVFYFGSATALDATVKAFITYATIRWSDGVWHFDFYVADADEVPARDIEMALLEYLSAQLSDGWGEDLTRYERLVGSEVWQPHFDEDQATWNYGFGTS